MNYTLKRQGFLDGTSGKESTCQCSRHKRHGFSPWVWKLPWRRKWQHTPVFLPGRTDVGEKRFVPTSNSAENPMLWDNLLIKGIFAPTLKLGV